MNSNVRGWGEDVKKCLKVRQVLGTSKVVRLSRLILGTTFVFMTMLKSVKLSGCQIVKFDPWDLMNNFCFHSQNSLFIGEKGNSFFDVPWFPAKKPDCHFQL